MRFTDRLDRLAAFADRQRDATWALVLLAVGVLIYLPQLGAFPLWDPWEPHYTQVAWEMQERGTWNNPWYRGRDNWWSKPILMLWMLRASLGLLWDSATSFLEHQWAARLPFALCAIGGGLLHFDWVRRLFGRNVAFVAGIILLTAPQYLVVGRQVMVDTPFVVAYGASLGYLAVGLFAQRPAPVSPPATGLRRVQAWLVRNAPFVAFWSLQGVAVLAKGFVAPVLAVIVLAGYGAATFRWQDYRALVAERRWLRYLSIRGGMAALVAVLGLGAILLLEHLGLASRLEQRQLLRALIASACGLGIALGIFHDLPIMRHALRLLVRIRASWGLALFLAVVAPWFLYMTVEHGWPYWKEFIFYHHLGRAAGTIDKPGGSFDLYVRHLGFSIFPWAAFGLGALWLFMTRSSPLRSIAERRNLYLLLAAALPYLFFSLSGTKFAHYIMPIVPMLAVLIAATLVWLGRHGEPQVRLAEAAPALGPEVEPQAAGAQPWWKSHGARGDSLVFATVALIAFGILAHDLVLDFRHLLRLFIYYRSRPTPLDFQPFIELQIIFFPLGIVVGTLLLTRWVSRWHRLCLGVGAVVFACHLSWVTMPAMGATYSYEPFVRAYAQLARPGEPIGQYNDWQQPARSVIFLFRNRAEHLGNDKQASAFLKRPGRKFVIVDRKHLADLRRVAREHERTLHVVFDGHPHARLVSDVPNPTDTRKVADHILSDVPPGLRRIDANFDDRIRLLGWRVENTKVRPGEATTVTFYYRCEQVIDRDWQIFVHGDGSRGKGHRIHADHYPVDGLYPTTEWQAGEIIRDEFRIEVPPGYPYDYFNLWTGFYLGRERMRLANYPPNDGHDRVRGPRIRVVRE